MIQNLLFIYQQEHYDAVRFIRFVYTKPNWFSFQKRQKLDKTTKAKLILLITYLTMISMLIGSVLLAPQPLVTLVLFVGIFLCAPIIIILASLLISPVVIIAKSKRVSHAKQVLQENRPIVIGITGSYGKSSLKEILSTSLRGAGASVIVTPGNINTTLGVAQYIIENQNSLKSTDYLVLEMGAYKKGNIKETAKFVEPDYSFLTAVGPVHIERFGSQENIIAAKAELLQNTTKHCYVNQDAGFTKESASLIDDGKYTMVSKSQISDVSFLGSFSGLEFTFAGQAYQTQLLAEHNTVLIAMAIAFMQDQEFDDEKIIQGVGKTIPFQHRLEPTHNKTTDVWVLDDSYNGNKDGFLSALSVLNRAKNRKIVLTPGIVELGPLTKTVHEEVAQAYIDNVDLVLLIDSVGTRYIKNYFDKNNFTKYQMFKSAPIAHSSLGEILQKGDTILFSNDLTDNYK